jgi:hypothetical protein
LVGVGKTTEFLKLLFQILLKLNIFVGWPGGGLMRLAKALGELNRALNRFVLVVPRDPLVGGNEERLKRSGGVGKSLPGGEVQRKELDVEHPDERVGDRLVE